MIFEWDSEKDIKNFSKHKLHLTSAIPFFDDENPDEEFDEAHSDEEDRHRGTFRWNNHYLYIVYTMRDEAIRIISARPATKGEINHYYNRI